MNTDTKIFLLAIFGIVVSCGIEASDQYIHDSTEYKNGYTNGYNEYNVTKTSAAFLVKCHEYGPFSKDRIYCEGYIDGYHARDWNETRKIVGV